MRSSFTGTEESHTLANLVTQFSVASAFALGILAITPHAVAEQRVLVKTITLVNEVGQGISGELRAVGADNTELHFAYTNDSGVATPNKLCGSEVRLRPRPRATGVYEDLDPLPYCRDGLKIVLRLTRVKNHLKSKADAAFQSGDYRLATLLYTESAERFRKVNEAQAEAAEFKAYEALSILIGGKVRFLTFDSVSRRAGLSSEGIDYLLDFQRSKKLAETGRLDPSTAQEISGLVLRPHIVEAYEFPYKK